MTKRTMDTVKSWLDAKELRRMAEELLEPAAEQEGVNPDAGYGEKFEGYTAKVAKGGGGEKSGGDVSPPVQAEAGKVEPVALDEEKAVADQTVDPAVKVRASVSSALAGARKVAEGSGMLQGGSGVSAPSEASGPVSVDTSKLKKSGAQWAEQFGLRGWFLVEGREKVVADTLGNAMLSQMAMRLVKTVPESGSLHMKVGSGSCLQVLSLGDKQVIFGALLNSPLAGDQLDRLSGVLIRDLA